MTETPFPLQPPAASYLDYWLLAAQHKGLAIAVTPGHMERAKSLLYSARNRSGIEALSFYQLRTSPLNPEGELLIIPAAPPRA